MDPRAPVMAMMVMTLREIEAQYNLDEVAMQRLEQQLQGKERNLVDGRVGYRQGDVVEALHGRAA